MSRSLLNGDGSRVDLHTAFLLVSTFASSLSRVRGESGTWHDCRPKMREPPEGGLGSGLAVAITAR